MKRIFALILSALLLFSAFAMPVSAESNSDEENQPTVVVSMKNEDLIFTDELIFRTFRLPFVGSSFSVSIVLLNFDGLKSGNLSIGYNSDIIAYDSYKIFSDYGADDLDMPVLIPREYLTCSVDDNKEGVIDIALESDGRDYEAVALTYVYFSCSDKGYCNFNITADGFVNADGEEIEVIVDNRLPAETHYFSELPDYKFDSSKCLAYGGILIRDGYTELAYPMTVKEFTDSLDCGDGYCYIEDKDGNLLNDNDSIPTAAVLQLCYADAVIQSMQFVLLGDVNCDGKITSADARIILRHSANVESVSGDAQRIAADTCQGKTSIEAKDARAVLRYSARIEDGYAEWFRYHKILKRYHNNLYTEV